MLRPAQHLRSRAAAAAGVWYLVTAAVCTRIPLLNYLGFESAFVTALMGSFVAGFLTIARLRPIYLAVQAQGQPFTARTAFASIIPVNLLLLAIPLALLCVNAVFVPNCDFAEGCAFFLLLPVVSVFFATALGLFCTVHYRHPRLAFMGYGILSVIYVLYTGYATPAIFSYNFFYGYFPGFSYDELLPLGWPLVTFRMLTVIVAGLFVWWSHIIVTGLPRDAGTFTKGAALLRILATRHTAASVLLLAGAAVLFLFRCQLGWESSAAFVRTTLGGMTETEHFTIYFDSSSTRVGDLAVIVQEHEFRLHQILEACALSRTEKIISYIYPTTESKRRLIGIGETEIAKPWSREVHMTRSSMDASLKHELVHVIAGQFGLPVIHASFSTGLVEGIAVAVDGSWGYRTLPQYAAALRAAGLAPPVDRLMTPAGFIAQSSSVSYVLAGAFCKFLLDTYGMRPLLQVYRTGDYETAYQLPLDALIAAWQRSLDAVPVGASDSASVDVFFRRPPLFGKVCARVHARRLREARELLRRHRDEEALERYAALAARSGGYDALAGLMTAHFRKGDYAAVNGLYDSVTTHDPIPRRYLALGIMAGDARWGNGDTAGAARLYGEVRAARLSPGLLEAAAVRLLILSDTAATRQLRWYFFTEQSDTALAAGLARPASGKAQELSHYLRGRIAFRMRRYDDAANLLQSVDAVRRDPELDAIRQRLRGDALVHCGRYEDAKSEYWTSLNNDASPYAVDDVGDRIARCDWLETQDVHGTRR